MTQKVPTDSAFRRWVQDIWRANCEEHLVYGEPQFTVKEYWARYKYWLKQEYRRQHEHSRDLTHIG